MTQQARCQGRLEGFEMLTKFNDPRVTELFRATWQGLDAVIRQSLDKKIAFVTDNVDWIPKNIPKEFFTQQANDPACLIDTKYIRGVDLYTMIVREPLLLRSDAEIRKTLAFELAGVFNDGQKWFLEVHEALEGRIALDPWIPEVLGEARDVNEFWEWLEQTVAFEAESKAREWGSGTATRRLFVTVDSSLAERIEESKPGTKKDGQPIPIPEELEMLFKSADLILEQGIMGN
jgi:hypothetical protein